MKKIPSDSAFDRWFEEVEAGDDPHWRLPVYGSKEWDVYISRRQLALGAWKGCVDEFTRLNGVTE